MNRWPLKELAEVVVLEFDFSLELGAETIVGQPTWDIAIAHGIDPSPGAVLYGAATVADQTVRQTVRAGLDRCDYKMRAEIDTSGGRHLVMVGVLPVRAL